MELLLTPVVNRLLSSLVKRTADGTAGSQLRVQLSGGSVVLHHLELNLDSVLGRLPIQVQRAFARQLRINVAWTALAKQPIQVVLDTVEVVLALQEDGGEAPPPKPPEGEADGGAAGWMGSLTSLLLRTLFNVSITLNNVVVKLLSPAAVATLTCQAAHTRTAADGWQAGLAKPQQWLKKLVEVQKAALWLEPRGGRPPAGAAQPPALRLPRADVAALVPVFAVVEGGAQGELQAEVELTLAPLEAVLTDRQVAWLRAFAAALPLAAEGGGAGGAEAPAEPAGAVAVDIAPGLEPGVPAPPAPPAAGGSGWLAAGLAGAAGQAWSYITDEAGAANATPAPAPAPAPRAAVSLRLHLALLGGALWAMHAGALPGPAEGEPPPSPPPSPPPGSYLQDLELASPKAARVAVEPPPRPPPPPDGTPSALALAAGGGARLLASLRWRELHVEARCSSQGLAALDASLEQVSLCRGLDAPAARAPFGTWEDEVVGLHAVPEVDMPALRRGAASLAARLRWQAGGGGRPPSAAASLARLGLAYPAGFAASVAAFLASGSSASPPEPAAKDDPAPAPAPPAGGSLARRWLGGGAAASLSILSLHAAALAGCGEGAAAAGLSLDGLSAQLGPVKPATRPGSVTAALFRLRPGPLPPRGLRLALAGLRLFAARAWLPAAAREEGGVPAGARAVSEPVELQLLLGLEPHPGPAQPAAADVVAAAATGPIGASLSGEEAGAALAAALSLAADASRGFRSPLPPPRLGPAEGASLARLSLQAPGACLLATAGAPRSWLPAPGSPLACAAPARLLLGAGELRLAVEAAGTEAAACARLQRPLVWAADGVAAELPASALWFGRPQLGNGRSSPPAAAGPSIAGEPACSLGRLRADGSLQSGPGGAGKVSAALVLESLLLGAGEEQWQAAVAVVSALAAQPLLPPLPAFPPVGGPAGQALRMRLSLRRLAGRVGPLAAELEGVEAAWEQRTSWAGAPLDADGFPPEPPPASKSVRLSLAALRLGCPREPARGLQDTPLLLRFLGSGRALACSLQSGGGQTSVSAEALPLRLRVSCADAASLALLGRATAAAVVRGRRPAAPAAARGAQQPARLEVRLAVPGAAASLAGPGGEALAVSVTDAVLVLYDDAAQRWAPGCSGRRGHLALRDAQATVCGPGLLPAGEPLLQPVDVHVALRTLGSSGASLVLDAPVLAARLSPAMLASGRRLAAALAAALPPARPVAESDAKPAAPADCLVDDLRCGLMELAPVAASRPGPLQISYGDRQPGSMPWSGQGESWVCWRFRHARPVAALLLALPPPALAAAGLELLAFSPAADAFLPVRTRASAAELGGQAGLLLVPEGPPPAAEEWQLCWDCTADGPQWRAAFVLQQLHVNPRGHSCCAAEVPPPLPCALLLGATATHLAVQLLDGGGSELAAARIDGFKAAAHVRGDSLAVRARGRLALACADGAQTCEEALLEPSELSVVWERRGWGGDATSAEQASAAPPALHLAAGEANLSGPFPPPASAGSSLALRSEGDAPRLRVSELGLAGLLQTVGALKAAFGAGQAPGGEQKAAAGPAAAIVLENRTQLLLEAGQLGCEDRASLAPGASLAYAWAAAGARDRRLLQLRLAAAAEQAEAEEDGWVLSGRPGACGPGRPGRGPEWSAGVDVMSPGGSLQQLPVGGPRAGALLLTVRVRREAGRWHAALLPGCAVVNRTGQRLLATAPPAAAGARGQPAAPQLELPPGGECRMLPAVAAAADGRRGNAAGGLRVWLGRGNGWSIPIPLHAARDQAFPVQAGGLGGSAPASPSAGGGDPGVLHARLALGGEQAALTLWPAALLRNELPCAVTWRLRRTEAEAAGGGAAFGAAAPARLLACAPGAEVPLHAAGHAVEALSLRLDAGGGQQAPWSAPLLLGAQADAGGWGLGAPPAAASLPEVGQRCMVEVRHAGRALAVQLSAEQIAPGLPCARLKLLPAAVVHNCTPHAVALHCPGGLAAPAPPGAEQPLDWLPLRQRPRRASLQHERKDGGPLASEAFPLEPGDYLLSLRPAGAGGAAGGEQPLLLLAARVELQQHPVPASAPALETLYLTLTPGCFLSNLTPWPLAVRPTQTAAAAAPLQVGPDETVPVSCVWSEAPPSGRPGGDTRGGGCLVSVQGSAQPPSAGGEGAEQEAFSCLTAPGPRRRLQLRTASGPRLVTARVAATRGRLHAVLFVDRQPPLVLQNATDAALQAGYFPHGASEPSALLTVAAGGSRESGLGAGLEGEEGDGQEDEEAFLERVTAEAAPAAGPPGQLRLRQPGAADWTAACPLAPGRHVQGGICITVSSCCASLLCEVSAAGEQPPPPPPPPPLRASLECPELQVCLLDDERGRLQAAGAAGAGPEAAPAELLCLYLSELRVDLGKHHASAAGTPHGRATYLARLAAGGLQLDSHLPHATHPVVCSTVAARPQPLPGVPEPPGRPPPPLLLHLEAAHAASLGTGPSFRNAWLRALGVRLPPLALAVDDALATFALRVAALWAAQRTPPPPPPAASRTGALLSPSKGTALDLSRLDSLGAAPRRASLGAVSPGSLASPPPGAQRQPLAGGWPSASLPATPRRQPDRRRDTPASPARPEAAPAPAVAEEAGPLAGLQAELHSEAVTAAASRLLVERFSLARLQLLLDLHISQGGYQLPFAVDTHRTPVGLPALAAAHLVFRPSVMAGGLLAHYAAETLLNAPALLGSLDLLGNPTGLVAAAGRGFEDLVSLPLAALEARSPAQFIAGLGLGSASLVRHVAGWGLASVAGFSSASARVLQRSLSAQAAVGGAVAPRRAPASLVGGLQGLAGGVSSGVTGLVRAPLAGYGRGSGSGLALGLGRGLLGAVGLPLSGTLDLVSSISAGLAATAGVAHTASLRRPGRTLGEVRGPQAAPRLRLAAALLREPYVGHCTAALVYLIPDDGSPRRLRAPLLLLAGGRLHLLQDGGLRPLLSLPLQGAAASLQPEERSFSLSGPASGAAGTAGVTVQVELELLAWHLWLPLLRAGLAAAGSRLA